MPICTWQNTKPAAAIVLVTGTNQSLTPSENIKLPGFKGDIADYVWRVKEYNEDEWSNRVIGSITTNYQILNNLKLRGRPGYRFHF